MNAVDQLATEWRQQKDPHAGGRDQQRAVDRHRRGHAAARHFAAPELAARLWIQTPEAGRAARCNQDGACGFWRAAVATNVGRFTPERELTDAADRGIRPDLHAGF